MRLRLLGENLIAFRDTSGRVGLIQNACPHRGASMFFGRNEEDGLRCVYHGWKFDTTGACVDMPSEPAESNFKNKVRTRAYPCVERNGVIWVYMGPRATPPPLPELPPNIDERCRASATPARVQLHAGPRRRHRHGAQRLPALRPHARIDDLVPGSIEYYTMKQRDARHRGLRHEMGATYGATARPRKTPSTGAGPLPAAVLHDECARRPAAGRTASTAWVPVDDENTWTLVWGCSSPRQGH